MAEQVQEVGTIEVTEEMIDAGRRAASEHFYDESDFAVVTREAVAEIFEAMLACWAQSSRAKNRPNLT